MGILKTIAQGGQTWAHRMRMIRQVIRIALGWGLAAGMGTLIYTIATQPKQQYWALWYRLKSETVGRIDDKVAVREQFLYPERINSQRVYHLRRQPLVKRCSREIASLLAVLQARIRIHILLFFYAFFGFIGFFLVRGMLSHKRKYISGSKRGSPRSTAWKYTLRGKASPYKLGGVPLIKGTENQHILLSGGTGSGKTNCFKHLLPQVRKQKQRAVVIDMTGEYVERYYRPGKDILFNPFDQRSVQWHPWCECRDVFDFDALAQSFIPVSYCEKENYWRSAGRTIFSAALQARRKSRNLSEVKNLILTEPLHVLYEELAHTKAAAHLDPSSEKTAGSIRSVASTFLECLEHVPDTEKPFSIREWVQSGNQNDSWLFLMGNPSQRSALTPLISALYSVAIRSVMQQKIDIHRRLWLITDELPSLHRLKDLEVCLAEGRKYGACAVLAIQSPAQLEAIYGHEITRVIIGNCATRIAFCEQDPEIAKRISKTFGESEVLENQEGISYGAHQMRDGVTLSQQRRMIPHVSAFDLQTLKRNEAFLKLPGESAAVQIRLSVVR